MNRLLTLIFLLLSSTAIWAQTAVTGSVANKEGEALAGSTVLFFQADTVAGGTVTDSKGRFELMGLPQGEYECRVSMLGYQPASKKFTLTEKIKIPKFVLEEDATMLGEVTVTGDARMRTKELAGMSIYYLSDRAKKEPNAFMALREIPRLWVNVSDRTINLDDGSAPLILVNGVKKPLDVLSPEFIESVEIIDNPSARYRGEGVATVLNVKLKKEGIKPYFRSNLGANASLADAKYLYSNASFETGTANSSLYLNGGYMQIRDQRYVSHYSITQGDISRELNSDGKSYWRNPFVNLGGDKEFSKKDYLAFSIKYNSNPQGGTTKTEGEIADMALGENSALSSLNHYKAKYHQLAANLYYKHSFTDRRLLEITGDYYFTNNGSKSDYEETSELMSYVSSIDQDNRRHMGKLNAIYSDMLTGSMHLEAGSNTEYSVTNIDDRHDEWPDFRYRRTREYLFAGIDNNRAESKFNYVVSLGLDMVFSDADGVRNSYIDFVPSVSLAYKPSWKHYINLNYNRSRRMPSAGELNPRNTSTNILFVNKGNPYLKPSHTDNVMLGYTFSNGVVRVNPFAAYGYSSNLVTPYGYMEDDDVYVSTYQNFGHSSHLQVGTMLSYNIPYKNGLYGNVSGYIACGKTFMEGMAFRGASLIANIQGYIGYKQVSLNAYFGYTGNSYSLYSKTRDQFASSLGFSWNVSQSVLLDLRVERPFWSGRAYKTWTVNGDYSSYSSSLQKTLSPKFQIGVWYTFQTKNFRWRDKKQLNGEDGELKTIKTE